MQGDWLPLRFISEKIDVEHKTPPFLTKKPTAPDSILWKGQNYEVEEVISSWFDYSRKGRMALNMKPENLMKAERRGSRGVGRFYFRVRIRGGRVFDIYYDRAPKDAGDSKGRWFLWRELESS
ncbi:MAG: DUF6504 family protein [Anaerolineales bacterium]|nr:DUF6504 family protein [Anaerolineales bacterium]